MVRKKEEVKPEEEAKVSPLLASLRKVVLASIGAAAIAQEEAEDLINRLVEKATAAFDARVHATLQKMNVPSKDDLKQVEKKLDELNKKLDKLVK
jgi:polyhydroxyalkanoate synthesis regulator phasin